MISIKVIASGSKGNCYSVTNGRHTLLLECGVSFSRIQKALDYKMSDIEGVLISHEHGDHSKAAHDVIRHGIDIYTSQGTADAVGLSGHRVNTMKAFQPFYIADWSILPFELEHDAAEPFGFLLSSGDEKVLFITDTAYCGYRFRGVTHLMIECNFSETILKENSKNGLVSEFLANRIRKTHFGLEKVKDFIKMNGTSRLQRVWLMHLSDYNSDEYHFKDEIQRLTGVEVNVC